VSGHVEIRPDAAGGPAAQALYDQYMALVCERIPGFVPSERIFGTEDAFDGEGGAWLVAYDEDGAPLGCGGLRTLAPGVGEILRELERRAAAHGHRSVRLVTTEVLSEAIALYDAEGYRAVQRTQRAGEPVEIWMEKELAT
jgi:hypothetical protein